MSARTAGRLRAWLSVRHSLRAEAVLVLALYGLHERSTGLFVEERVQDTVHALAGLRLKAHFSGATPREPAET